MRERDHNPKSPPRSSFPLNAQESGSLDDDWVVSDSSSAVGADLVPILDADNTTAEVEFAQPEALSPSSELLVPLDLDLLLT